MSKYGIPCCGKRHDTPYCPLCGKQLVEKHELGDLLRHCETTLQNLKDAYAIRVSRGQPCEKKENVIARWQRWVNGLRRLIDDQEANLLKAKRNRAGHNGDNKPCMSSPDPIAQRLRA